MASRASRVAGLAGLFLVAGALLLGFTLAPTASGAGGPFERARAIASASHYYVWQACWASVALGAVLLLRILFLLGSVMEGSRRSWRELYRIVGFLGMLCALLAASTYGMSYTDYARAPSVDNLQKIRDTDPQVEFLHGVMGWGLLGGACGIASLAGLRDRHMPVVLGWLGVLAAAFAGMLAFASLPPVRQLETIRWAQPATLASLGVWCWGLGALYLGGQRGRV